MKKWRCSVCGYVHTGSEPPEKCPVCGADKSLFDEVAEESEAASKAPEIDGKEQEKWALKCSACDYRHTDGELPEKCPVCGADKDMFKIETSPEPDDSVEISKKKEPSETDKALASRAADIYDMIVKQMLKHHAHPVSVHIPNGVLPMSVFFIIMSVGFQISDMGTAAFYNMVFVVITLPFVLFSGYIEWKKRYGGHLTKVFVMKIIFAMIVTVSAVMIVGWQIVNPKVMDVYSSDRWTFLLLNIIMLFAAIFAGMIGGKLVFKD